MKAQTLLKQLGFSKNDRLVILHADDIGMCQATLTAFDDLWQSGGVSSGAVMVPCPWFPSVAAYCRENPDVDMGIHATLNCEWDACRWGAVSTCDPASGLLDEDGYLHHKSETTATMATNEAVATELAAQVNLALKNGIGITHIDSHMGTILHPRFIMTYLTHALTQRVPAMQPRVSAVGVKDLGATDETLAMLAPILDQIESQGMPLIDGLMMMPLHQPDGQMEIAKQMLSNLPIGITHFIFHPAVDTPELRALCPDWPSRVANYHTFMAPEIRRFIKDEGIHVIGYKHLREWIRSA
jgi:predicted glycoside hydrolase/deacetylase ChbG (UPF0249 family)